MKIKINSKFDGELRFALFSCIIGVLAGRLSAGMVVEGVTFEDIGSSDFIIEASLAELDHAQVLREALRRVLDNERL